MNGMIRWGILGTGQMAEKFAQGLRGARGAELAAVCSRSPERAKAFADRTGIQDVLDGYDRLLERGDIDAVYVATPISEHMEHISLCLEHEKAVLCEKAFTVSAAQAQRVIDLARAKRLFLMEAMWNRFLPAMRGVRRWLADRALGKVSFLTGDLGFLMPYDRASLLFAPELAGGALLSVGVYAVSLGSMVFGAEPLEITTIGQLGETGVDERFSLAMRYPCGGMANFTVSIRCRMNQEARIYGEKGMIKMPKFFAPRTAELWLDGKETAFCDPGFPGNGYQHEAEAASNCLRAGALECAEMPLAETLSVMRTMDALRKAWGLRYPCEKASDE